MENNKDKYIEVSYKLYIVEGEQVELVEETRDDRPFSFISGFGVTLDAFEKEVSKLKKGDKFNFTLSPTEAYGEHLEEHVLDLEKEMFTINGHFDSDNIYKNAIVPLQNEDGHRFMGKVLDISEAIVKMDLNHPLAGKTLNFKGEILESRDATKEEIENLVNHISGSDSCCGGGCGCDCEGHDHEHKNEHGGCCCNH